MRCGKRYPDKRIGIQTITAIFLSLLWLQSAQAQVANTCNGRPITRLNIDRRHACVWYSGTAGAIYRFANAAPGIDVRIRLDAFNNGATLNTFDDNATNADNFQPTIGGSNARSIDYTMFIYDAGTTTLRPLDFAMSVIDVDVPVASSASLINSVRQDWLHIA